MKNRTLEDRMEHAQERLAAANEALSAAAMKRFEAREMSGGLLSFGGSGSQRANRQVQAATDAALRGYADASKRVAHWTNEIARIERAITERDRTRFTLEDLVGVTHVRTTYGWSKVVRLNSKTVTVTTPWSWTDRLEFDRILETRTLEEHQ